MYICLVIKIMLWEAHAVADKREDDLRSSGTDELLELGGSVNIHKVSRREANLCCQQHIQELWRIRIGLL